MMPIIHANNICNMKTTSRVWLRFSEQQIIPNFPDLPAYENNFGQVI